MRIYYHSIFVFLGMLFSVQVFAQSDTLVCVSPLITEPIQRCGTIPMPQSLVFAGEKIPLDRPDVRESLLHEITVNTYRHSNTIKILRNIERWRTFVVDILKEQNVPEDFIYLAIIESEFDNNAKSPTGASGMWQLMEETAKEYQLEINEDVDMRRDPKLATIAACKFLKQSNSNFNNWINTAAAYNVGIKGMLNRLATQKQKSFFDLYLNPETSRYVYRILALKVIIENPEGYGFFLSPIDQYPPYKFKTVTVNYEIVNLVDFAKEYNCSYKDLRLLNPWFNNSNTFSLRASTNRSYEIRVPIL